MTKKKCYEAPALSVERFSPNAYCAGCYNYTGVLKCKYGQKARQTSKTVYGEEDGYEHGSPCSEITLEADGVNITGKEYGKDNVSIYNVNVGNFDWSTAANGITVENVSWNSVYGYTYTHIGTLTFTSKAEQIEGRPNHS